VVERPSLATVLRLRSRLQKRARVVLAEMNRGASDEEALITKFVERSARYNAALERAARTSNGRMIRVNGNSPPDTMCTRVFNAIT
jgi:hypothetical protein